ncbi:MAG: type II toxin-antitoxin system RelE/ParE family toxin [Thermoplasmata archaeon]
MRKLIWTEPALSDLQAIFDYISKDSEYYASIFIGEIIESAEKSTGFPEIGRIVPEYQQEDIREILVHSYRVIYQLEQNQILILTVIHGRRDLTKLMELDEKEQ